MPKLALPWDDIRARIPDGDTPDGLGARYVFLLPNAGRFLLLALTELLEWRATYFDGRDYDSDKWDLLQDVVGLTTNGLLEGVPLSDILAEFDETQDLIQQLIDKSCCDGYYVPSTNGDGVTSTPVGMPEEIVPEPTWTGTDYPVTDGTDTDDSGTVTEAEWDDYQCRTAHYFFGAVRDMLLRLKLSMQRSQSVADFLMDSITVLANHLIPGPHDGFVWIAVENLSDLVNDVQGQLIESAIDNCIAQWDAIEDDVICALYGAESFSAWWTAFTNAVTSNLSGLSAGVGVLLINGPLVAAARLIWHGMNNPPVSSCSCVNLYDWQAEWSAAATFDPWKPGNAAGTVSTFEGVSVSGMRYYSGSSNLAYGYYGTPDLQDKIAETMGSWTHDDNSPDYRVRYVRMEVIWGSACTAGIDIRFRKADGSYETVARKYAADGTVFEWEFSPGQGLYLEASSTNIRISSLSADSQTTDADRVLVTKLRIHGEYTG